MLVIKARPKLYLIEPETKWRKIFYFIGKSSRFDKFIYIAIMLNTLILTINWYGNPESVEFVLSILNNVFVIIFTLEASIKIVGFGKRYFKDNWNNFDLAVVVLSLVGSFMSNVLNISGGSATTVVRTLRLLRVLKLFKK